MTPQMLYETAVSSSGSCCSIAYTLPSLADMPAPKNWHAVEIIRLCFVCCTCTTASQYHFVILAHEGLKHLLNQSQLF